MRKTTVVVVEDDAMQAQNFSRILRKSNMNPVLARHAIEAIDLIDAEKPDVIVLDMLLVGSTGFVLLNELQSHPDLAKIPVIVCTNMIDQISLKNLKPYGVKRIIDKTTMKPSDLPEEIKAVLA